jgi:hypothetical protein
MRQNPGLSRVKWRGNYFSKSLDELLDEGLIELGSLKNKKRNVFSALL